MAWDLVTPALGVRCQATVRQHAGVPVTRTAPIVVAERVTDLLALVLLLFVGSLVYRTGWIQLAGSAAIALGLVAALASPHLAQLVLHALERIGPARRYVEGVERAHESMRTLLRPGLLAPATLLGAVAWFAECLGFTLVLHGFGVDTHVARANIHLRILDFVGGAPVFAGGLGGTEGTMVALLVADGALKPLAVAATFGTRVATLWFAVWLGTGFCL